MVPLRRASSSHSRFFPLLMAAAFQCNQSFVGSSSLRPFCWALDFRKLSFRCFAAFSEPFDDIDQCGTAWCHPLGPGSCTTPCSRALRPSVLRGSWLSRGALLLCWTSSRYTLLTRSSWFSFQPTHQTVSSAPVHIKKRSRAAQFADLSKLCTRRPKSEGLGAISLYSSLLLRAPRTDRAERMACCGICSRCC